MKKVYSAPELEVELFDAVVMELAQAGSEVNFDTPDEVGPNRNSRGLFDPDNILRS